MNVDGASFRSRSLQFLVRVRCVRPSRLVGWICLVRSSAAAARHARRYRQPRHATRSMGCPPRSQPTSCAYLPVVAVAPLGAQRRAEPAVTDRTVRRRPPPVLQRCSRIPCRNPRGWCDSKPAWRQSQVAWRRGIARPPALDLAPGRYRCADPARCESRGGYHGQLAHDPEIAISDAGPTRARKSHPLARRRGRAADRVRSASLSCQLIDSQRQAADRASANGRPSARFPEQR